MTTAIVDLASVELDSQGFFVHPDQWTEEMVSDLARRDGIDPVTEAHWTVIRFMRNEYVTKGTGPAVRALSKDSGVPIKELYQLFPKGPAKSAARIAGIPKPRGCV